MGWRGWQGFYMFVGMALLLTIGASAQDGPLPGGPQQSQDARPPQNEGVPAEKPRVSLRLFAGSTFAAGEFRATPHRQGGFPLWGGAMGAELNVPLAGEGIAWTSGLQYVFCSVVNDNWVQAREYFDQDWRVVPLLTGLTLRGRAGKHVSLYIQGLAGAAWARPAERYDNPERHKRASPYHEIVTASWALEAGVEIEGVTLGLRVLDLGRPDLEYDQYIRYGTVTVTSSSPRKILFLLVLLGVRI